MNQKSFREQDGVLLNLKAVASAPFDVDDIISCTQYHTMTTTMLRKQKLPVHKKSCLEHDSSLLDLTTAVSTTQCFELQNHKSKLTGY